MLKLAIFSSRSGSSLHLQQQIDSPNFIYVPLIFLRKTFYVEKFPFYLPYAVLDTLFEFSNFPKTKFTQKNPIWERRGFIENFNFDLPSD